MWTAFVTGCSTGFGHAVARKLLQGGHRVAASSTTRGPWVDALGGLGGDLLPLALDVRSDAAVADAVGQALAWGEVDVLVNNAGRGFFASQEEGSLDTFRDLLDVNVLGPARLTRALLPSLRRTRGTVVQLSSVAGHTVFPESGFYAATKHALEAMSEALVQEVGPHGVRVRLIEPGQFDTCFQVNAANASPVMGDDSPYTGQRPTWRARRHDVLEPPQDPERVADAIVAALEDPAPFRRIPVGPDAERILALRRELGPEAWGRLSADRNGLDDPHRRPGEVLSPREVLALPPESDALGPTCAAVGLGHLRHWAEDDLGRKALAHLGLR
jgi:NAD(P)-dependent dehydrogenase (short-subunit alcohol dehydrogenase family)